MISNLSIKPFRDDYENLELLRGDRMDHGDYPQGAFDRARFFPHFRAVDLCSRIFEPGLSFGKIKDVYEIQV